MRAPQWRQIELGHGCLSMSKAEVLALRVLFEVVKKANNQAAACGDAHQVGRPSSSGCSSGKSCRMVASLTPCSAQDFVAPETCAGRIGGISAALVESLAMTRAAEAQSSPRAQTLRVRPLIDHMPIDQGGGNGTGVGGVPSGAPWHRCHCSCTPRRVTSASTKARSMSVVASMNRMSRTCLS